MYDQGIIARYQEAYAELYGEPVRGLEQDGNRLVFPVEGVWPRRVMSEGEAEVAAINLRRLVVRAVLRLR